jgi:DNA repair exonuclease SbcCD ATPase subunit
MPEHAKNHSPISLPVLLVCAAVVGAGGVILWQARLISTQASQLVARAAENDALRRRILQLSRAQPAPMSAQGPVPVPRSAPPHAPAADAGAAAAQQEAQRLRENLTQSSAEMSRLQGRVAELQSQIETVTTENHRLSAVAEDLRKNAADADQTLEALHAEVKKNSDRVAQLESLNTRLKEDTASRGQSAAELNQIISDLQGVFRRREMYLNNILRRYREITEQYRAMSGVMDSRRDRGAAPVGGTEIARIQNTITQAEEDLKQINALNAQAQHLQKKLPAK